MRQDLEVKTYNLQRQIIDFREELRKSKKKDILSVFRFSLLVEELNAHTNRLRKTRNSTDPLVLSSEETLAMAVHDVLMRAKSEKKSAWDRTLTANYRIAIQKNLDLFIFTFALFVVSSVVGYAMTTSQPDYSALFISQEMLENIMDHQAWFERIQKDPLFYGFNIALNNIKVALMACILGAIAGIGGIYILALNGLMLGSVLALCQIYGFHDSLITFIVGHGPLELTLIIMSTFASFIFGRVFYQRPYSLFRLRAKQATKESISIIYGVTIWLCVAACIEVGISPWPIFSQGTKITIGLLAATIFWYWSLRPLPQEYKDERTMS